MKYFKLFVFVIASISSFGNKDSVSIMFYNVENLFDTVDNKNKNDDEFLPYKKKRWNNQKLKEKTTRIAKVIAASNFPDIIGLAEIENDSVLQKLANHYILRKIQYSVIHFESADLRGIDCAILYKHKKLDLHSMKPNQVILNGRPTRDILGATFSFKKDTFSVFVNHWPSRYGGKNKSIPKRAKASKVLLSLMDSVSNNFQSRKIISMGDFNDETNDSSILAFKDYDNTSNKFKGTLKYRGKWQVFDQFICSSNFTYHSMAFKPKFLLEEDKSYGGLKPFRTYYGPMYHNGFSDHLPILLIFYVP